MKLAIYSLMVHRLMRACGHDRATIFRNQNVADVKTPSLAAKRNNMDPNNFGLGGGMHIPFRKKVKVFCIFLFLISLRNENLFLQIHKARPMPEGLVKFFAAKAKQNQGGNGLVGH